MRLHSIAVLPLQNLNGDLGTDYLRFALADEIANVLTYSRTLDVRPSALTRKYANADLDLRRAGQELHVATALTSVNTIHFSSRAIRPRRPTHRRRCRCPSPHVRTVGYIS
jgi:hypothetical protein